MFRCTRYEFCRKSGGCTGYTCMAYMDCDNCLYSCKNDNKDCDHERAKTEKKRNREWGLSVD